MTVMAALLAYRARRRPRADQMRRLHAARMVDDYRALCGADLGAPAPGVRRFVDVDNASRCQECHRRAVRLEAESTA